MAQTVKCMSAMQETLVRSLGWEDPLEKKTAAHSSTLAWKIPWTEKPGRLLSMGLQRVRHNWDTSLSLLVLSIIENQSSLKKGRSSSCLLPAVPKSFFFALLFIFYVSLNIINTGHLEFIVVTTEQTWDIASTSLSRAAPFLCSYGLLLPGLEGITGSSAWIRPFRQEPVC